MVVLWSNVLMISEMNVQLFISKPRSSASMLVSETEWKQFHIFYDFP